MPKIARLLTLLIFLQGLRMPAATRTEWVVVTVSIRPAVVVKVQGAEAIGVTIRLAPQTQAKLWKGYECVVMPANAHVIAASGIYTVPLSDIEGQGSQVCLVSTDGNLSVSVSLPPTTP
jgi:hypothetical protein